MRLLITYSAFGLLLNLGFYHIKVIFSDLLFMDTVGTAFSSLLLGPWWGASVGCVTNVLIALIYQEPTYVNYTIINVLIALLLGLLGRGKFQIFSQSNNERQILVKIITWGFIIAISTSLLSTYITSGYSVVTAVTLENQEVYSMFIKEIGESVYTFLGIPYDLLRNFPDKLISIAFALFIIFYFVDQKYYQIMSANRVITWGTKSSATIFIIVYGYLFYENAVFGSLVL